MDRQTKEKRKENVRDKNMPRSAFSGFRNPEKGCRCNSKTNRVKASDLVAKSKTKLKIPIAAESQNCGTELSLSGDKLSGRLLTTPPPLFRPLFLRFPPIRYNIFHFFEF